MGTSPSGSLLTPNSTSFSETDTIKFPPAESPTRQTFSPVQPLRENEKILAKNKNTKFLVIYKNPGISIKNLFCWTRKGIFRCQRVVNRNKWAFQRFGPRTKISLKINLILKKV